MKYHLQGHLFAECVGIHMAKRGEDTVVLERGDWFKPNPDYPASVDDEQEFIDCEPDDEGAQWSPSGVYISVPLEGMDMPGIGDNYRLTVERMVSL